MTSLLAIDAATEACSVALLHRGEQMEDFRLEPRSHTRLMLPMIEGLLAEAGVALAGLDGIAFSAGPGSFTGLRVACATVQGLAFALDIPVIPISTLQLLAQCGVSRFELRDGDLVVPCLDARMSEIYWGHYGVESGLAMPCMADQLSLPSQLFIGDAGGAAVWGVGNGWQYRDQFALLRPTSAVDPELHPHAVGLLPLAEARFEKDDVLSADQAQPQYLRNSVAWQKSG